MKFKEKCARGITIVLVLAEHFWQFLLIPLERMPHLRPKGVMKAMCDWESDLARLFSRLHLQLYTTASIILRYQININ